MICPVNNYFTVYLSNGMALKGREGECPAFAILSCGSWNENSLIIMVPLRLVETS